MSEEVVELNFLNHTETSKSKLSYTSTEEISLNDIRAPQISIE